MVKLRTWPHLGVLWGLLAALTCAATLQANAATTDWVWANRAALIPNRTGSTATLVKLNKSGSTVLAVGGLTQVSQFEVNLVPFTQELQVEKNQWTPTGPNLKTPRLSHTATLLQNETVLVAGGKVMDSGKDSSISLCEILDLQNDGVSTSPLNFPRESHTATPVTLPSGVSTILVAGGTYTKNGGLISYLGTSELYVPGGPWQTANMKQARTGHTATVLNDGRVLVVGGFEFKFDSEAGRFAPAVAACEIYNPADNSWTTADQLKLHQARGWHTAARLADGRVLVAGGTTHGDRGTPLDTYEIYDPNITDPAESASWIYDPNKHMVMFRSMPASTLLKDGKVLVIGGEGADPAVKRSSEFYQPDLDSWALATSGLKADRVGCTALLLNNDDGWVFVAGGGPSICQVFRPPGGFLIPGASRPNPFRLPFK